MKANVKEKVVEKLSAIDEGQKDSKESCLAFCSGKGSDKFQFSKYVFHCLFFYRTQLVLLSRSEDRLYVKFKTSATISSSYIRSSSIRRKVKKR